MEDGARDLDEALRAAFESEAGESVIGRLGAKSRILLHDAPEDASPLISLRPPAGEEGAEGDSRYQIVGEIGRGGVGVVYKGRDKELGRDVALKVLRTRHDESSEVFQRFIEEAQIGAQLQHPGIVPVYGIGLRPDGRPYFTMKLIKGRTLAALLRERKDPGRDRRRFLQIFEQICQAMGYAHTRGVIHRDLKPGNVLVGNFGEVMVVDWGFGKVLGRADHTAERLQERTVVATVRSASEGSESIAGSVMGTPAYMPPEQALGHVEELDEQSDVFSLGAILCQILSGAPPYTGPSKDLLVLAAQARLDDAHARLDGCGADPELVALVKRCLSPRRSDRPANAGDLAHAITDHLAGAEERAHQAEIDLVKERARLEQERRNAVWQRRRKRKARLLAGSLLFAVGLGAGAWLWNDANLRARAAAVRPRVEQAMEQGAHLAGQGKWTEALSVSRKGVALAEDADPDVRRRALALAAEVAGGAEAASAEAAQKDKDGHLLAALERVRLRTNDEFDFREIDQEYAAAFEDYGLALDADAGEALRGRGEDFAAEVAAALDFWAWMRREYLGLERAHWEPLIAIASSADPDEERERLRRAVIEADQAELKRLASSQDLGRFSAQSLYLLALGLAKAGDAQAAVDLLRAAELRYPQELWILSWLGLALERTRPADAVRYYTMALALRPRSVELRHRLGIALQNDGEPEAAIAVWRDALALRPGYGHVLGHVAWILLEAGRADEAEEAAREAVRLQADDEYPYRMLSQVLGEKGSLDEAIAVAREAVRLFPRNAACHNGLGVQLQKRGLREEEIAAFREAVRLAPTHALYRCRLGNALREKGEIDEAVIALREAIGMQPDYALAHHGLGGALLDKGDPDAAIPAYREAIRLQPDVVESRLGLALALRAKNQHAEALAVYREAIRIDPQCFKSHYYLATLLTDVLQRHDEAISEFRETIRLKPDYAAAHHGLGLALTRLGRLDEAMAALRVALRIEPDRLVFHLARGQVLVQKGLLDEAIEVFREAIRLRPEAIDPRYNAACAAALAAAGAGDAAGTSTDQRARWRADALGWLQEELALLRKAAETRPAAVSPIIEYWLDDPDLESVRDVAALPAAEREAWRALWREVNDFVAQLREGQ